MVTWARSRGAKGLFTAVITAVMTVCVSLIACGHGFAVSAAAPEVLVRHALGDDPPPPSLANSIGFLVLLAALTGLGLRLLSPSQCSGRTAGALLVVIVIVGSLAQASKFFDLWLSYSPALKEQERTARSAFLMVLSLFIGAVAFFGGLAQQARTVDARNASRR